MSEEKNLAGAFEPPPPDPIPGRTAGGGDLAGEIASLGKAQVPLIIGLVADGQLSEEAIRLAHDPIFAALTDLCKRYPATPLLLITQSLPTFDGLAARAALKTGSRVIEIDGSPASRGYSREARRTKDVATVQNDGVVDAAAFLAEHCHFFIGISPSGNLRSSCLVDTVIAFRLHGIPDRYTCQEASLDRIGLGNVYHVVVADDSKAAGELTACELLVPPAEASFGNTGMSEAMIWDHLERFNRDAARQVEQRERAGTWKQPPQAGAADVNSWIRCRFAIADLLAMRFQRYTHHTASSLLVLGVLALAAFQSSMHFPTMTILYAAFLLLAFGWHQWARGRQFERRFQDYRALAEGFRIQMYWREAGIGAFVADHYLRRQRSELEWIRRALRTCKLLPRPLQSEPADLISSERDRMERVLEEWVDGQWQFYASKTLLNRNADVRLSRANMCLFLLGMLLAGAKPILFSGELVTGAIAMTAVVAGMLHVYARTRAFAEQARQYQRMAQLFGDARVRLRRLLDEGNLVACRRCLLELGKEALAEHGDWLLLHRERPISFDTAPAWLSGALWFMGVCLRVRQRRAKKDSIV